MEQNYLLIWKSYYRALRHRHALLKSERSSNSSEMAGWERLMYEEAIKIESMRKEYISDLNRILNRKHMPVVLFGTVKIDYSNDVYTEQGLEHLLAENRKEDVNSMFHVKHGKIQKMVE